MIQVRRNFSHHNYWGGWSQGLNFELPGSPDIIVEHNVVYGSSWPARGVGCEFRYNLVLEAGHHWMWADTDNGYIHHNVFIGGEMDGGGIWSSYSSKNVRIANNTFDALGSSTAVTIINDDNGSFGLTSNIFMNLPKGPSVTVGSGTIAADYNLFFDTPSPNYSDSRNPAHDVAGGVQTDPRLANPATKIFELDEANVWKRNVTVRDVLNQYRMRYMPQSGSPAIDKGDPAGGSGNDVGAVGAGETNASDQFGLL
jgi:hypothetical protein